MVVWEGGREGLGFRGLRQGVRGLRRGTKGSRGFSEQGHQAKAQMNQSPPAKLSRASEPLQSSGAVCKPQTPSTHTHPPKPHTEHHPPQNKNKNTILPGFKTYFNSQTSLWRPREVNTGLRSSYFAPSQMSTANQCGCSSLTEPVMGKAGTQILGRLTEG